MTCNLKRPDPQTLFEQIKGFFEANVLGGGKVVPESNEWYVCATDYAAAEAFYSIAEQQWREQDPRFACCDNLIEIAARDGMYPRPASFAKSYVKISGTPGSGIPANLIVSLNDRYYQLDAGATVPLSIPASGYVVARVAAQTPGPDTNTATTGKLVTQAAGLSNTVEVYGGQFCGGQAAESCEEFRTRYLARKAYQPRANFAWAVEKLKEWPCLTRVCVSSCNCCPQVGSLELFVFFDGTFANGIPPANVLEDVERWFFGDPQGFGFGQVEIGITGKLMAATPIPVDINIDNLPCSSSAQTQEIRNRLTAMFASLCPGAPICRRMVDAVIMQVLGPACECDVELRPVGTATTFCEDWTPACDELPVAGTIKISGSL